MKERIPVQNVGVYLNSKFQPKGADLRTHSFQTIAQADAFLKSQHTIEHWVFQVNWVDGTSQKGHLFDRQRYISQWLKTWADRMINGPAEAPEEMRKEFVRQTKEQDPKLIRHAHKLLDELQIE